ncbi:hypothetical protein VCHC72A2_01302A, partial [Vibrio cholerae HC-72A2]
MISRKQKTQS